MTEKGILHAFKRAAVRAVGLIDMKEKKAIFEINAWRQDTHPSIVAYFRNVFVPFL